jgi:mono/diheme cytochrome c family protein
MRRIAAIFAAVLLSATALARAEPPAQLYMLNCWGCHRPQGEGIPGTAPALRGTADFLKVPGGRAYLIEVPGVSSSALDDAQVAEVMNWILLSFSKAQLPADFKPYTEAEVKQYRGVKMLSVIAARKKLIDEMVGMKVRPAEKP